MRRVTLASMAVLFCLCFNSIGQDATSARRDDNPRIVAKLDLLNHTGPLSPITIYTPKHSGTFRASTVVIETVACGCSGNYLPQFGLTYRNNSFVETFNFTEFFPSETLYPYHGVATIAADAGKPITFSVPADGDIAGSNYDVHVVVEELE